MSTPDTNDRVRRQQLYNNPSLSDITIHYDTHSIHAHKAILSMSSSYFHRAFTGDFKESTTSSMSLLEDDPEAITGMLRHIYGFEPSPTDGSAFFQIQLMVVADKYAVETLSALSKSALAQRLESLAFPWADFYPDLLEEIYAAPACDKEIRGWAVDVARRDLGGWMKEEGFLRVLRERQEVCVDLLRALAARAEDLGELKPRFETPALLSTGLLLRDNNTNVGTTVIRRGPAKTSKGLFPRP